MRVREAVRIMSSEKVLAKSMVPSWPHFAKKSWKPKQAPQHELFTSMLVHMRHPYLPSGGCACAGNWHCGPHFSDQEGLMLQAQEAGLACASWTK